MPDIEVTFDPRKIGGTESPVTVSPKVLHLPPGATQRIRFTLRTVGAERAAFDMTPALFNPGDAVRFAEPVPVGSTSFSVVIDESRGRDARPRRLDCTLWVRYGRQCYPALYPTIVQEPALASRIRTVDLVDAEVCAV